MTAAVPAGTDITSAAALATAAASDTLSAAPQQALLAMAAAAALLAITGFWVSIAADVRRRRGETALLAALGVTRRGAALQLCLEKLLLSLPSAALGVLLGTLVAWLLVPAVTLTPTAQQPTPPAVTQYDLPQAIALALAVAVLPAVTAALAATRRPDPAAELRAAEGGKHERPAPGDRHGERGKSRARAPGRGLRARRHRRPQGGAGDGTARRCSRR